MIILTGGAGMIGSMVAWHLNTILNEDQFVIVDELLNKNYDPVIFGVTDVDYETLYVNQAKILQLVRQQKAVVIAYEEYYNRQHLHIAENNESARAQSSETEDSSGEEDDVDPEDGSFLKGLRTWRPW